MNDLLLFNPFLTHYLVIFAIILDLNKNAQIHEIKMVRLVYEYVKIRTI